jgi:hypothetical protein
MTCLPDCPFRDDPQAEHRPDCPSVDVRHHFSWCTGHKGERDSSTWYDCRVRFAVPDGTVEIVGVHGEDVTFTAELESDDPVRAMWSLSISATTPYELERPVRRFIPLEDRLPKSAWHDALALFADHYLDAFGCRC